VEKTYLPPTNNTADAKWYIIDAADQRLGRLASQIAMVLRGKNKPTFTPHIDTGDFVIVINAEKVQVTGKKSTQKVYRRHSGRPGGMKTEVFSKLQVKGMLPKNSMGKHLFTKMNVYAGTQHPHAAQKPEVLVIKTTPGA
jgi:large subunit ribosomal protein L13